MAENEGVSRAETRLIDVSRELENAAVSLQTLVDQIRANAEMLAYEASVLKRGKGPEEEADVV